MSTADRLCLGSPPTGKNDENISKIKCAIDEDSRKTIDQVSEEMKGSWSMVLQILTECFHMRRVSVKFVPRLLRDDQRESRVNICCDLKSEKQNDPYVLKINETETES
ncbi:mariner Mos1 transposase [Trichonephila clavipes]|nr:mariner Mos1 transposase [Trichonephila clavipes]